MQDVLRDYIVDSATPELAQALIEAHTVFDRIDQPEYEGGFEEILMMDDLTDENGTLTAIVNLTTSLQHQILSEHAVSLSDTADMEMATVFITGILDVETYDNKTQLLQTASLDGFPEEVFAEVMALVSKHNAEELLPYIEVVSPTVITAIKDLATEETPLADTEEERQAKLDALLSFNHFLHAYGNKRLAIAKLLMQGLDVGYPFSVYIGMVGRDLESMKPEQAAQELVGMALISSDGRTNPLNVIKQNIDHYIADVDMITKINVIVSNYIMGMQK